MEVVCRAGRLHGGMCVACALVERLCEVVAQFHGQKNEISIAPTDSFVPGGWCVSHSVVRVWTAWRIAGKGESPDMNDSNWMVPGEMVFSCGRQRWTRGNHKRRGTAVGQRECEVCSVAVWYDRSL